MDQFKVGDRVIVNGQIDERVFIKRIGTIRAIDEEFRLEVEFDDWYKGHNGSDIASSAMNHWYIDETHHTAVTVIATTANDVSALLPHAADERKRIPLSSGLFDYFTSALIEVSKVSYKGNEQHNPGEPLHWARGKSTDHADTMLRHFAERGTLDTDGTRHSAKMVWRALAILQMELENEGYPKARGAR